MSLVVLDEEAGLASTGMSNRIPPEWVNYLDETQYEFTRYLSMPFAILFTDTTAHIIDSMVYFRSVSPRILYLLISVALLSYEIKCVL